jgi:hypothetical protein
MMSSTLRRIGRVERARVAERRTHTRRHHFRGPAACLFSAINKRSSEEAIRLAEAGRAIQPSRKIKAHDIVGASVAFTCVIGDD